MTASSLREAARAAAREIVANKFRSALSFAAVSVGVASLLYSLAQTQGMRQELEKNIVLMGPGRLTVQPKRNYVSKGLSAGLTLDDAQAIAAEIPGLYMVSPYSADWGFKGFEGRSDLGDLHVAGVTPDWAKRDWVYRQRGRFLNGYDVRARSRVAVMVLPAKWLHKPFWASFWNRGEKYQAFSERHDWLGRQIRIEDAVFTVVGVLTPPYRDLDPRWDSWDTPEAIVPLTAFQDRLDRQRNGTPRVGEIRVDTGDEKTIAARRREIEAVLKRRHRGEEDFEVKSAREDIEGEMENQKAYVLAGIALGIVALLAGGIGIMNVTLATIFSRVKEIGIRRAVGARKGDIMAQFLFEAALLGAAGGVAGVALGLVGVGWLSSLGEGREVAKITWLHCALVTLLASAVSAAFASVPAWRAAQLDPVEALRSEA